MNVEGAGLHSSSQMKQTQSKQVDSLQKILDAFKDMQSADNPKQTELVTSLNTFIQDVQNQSNLDQASGLLNLAVSGAQVLDKIGNIDPEFLTELVEELSDRKKTNRNMMSTYMSERVQEVEINAATQFLAIHQSSTQVSGSTIRSTSSTTEVGDYHPALDNVEVEEGIEERGSMGEIMGMVEKQNIALENAGLVAPPVSIDVDPNLVNDLTLGGIIGLAQSLREARSQQAANGAGEVKSFYTAGASMTDLIVGVIDSGDAEAEIRALLNKPFLSDEDILLIMTLLGDLGMAVPAGLLDEIKEKISAFLEQAAQNATSPSDFMMIAELVKAVADSVLSESIDEEELLSILNGQFGQEAGSVDELASNLLESLEDGIQADVLLNPDEGTVNLGPVGSADNPVDVNLHQHISAQAGNAFLESQVEAIETGNVEELAEANDNKVESIDEQGTSDFVYNFNESITKIVEQFMQKELDNTLENFSQNIP